MKEKYNRTELEIIEFTTDDVLNTSVPREEDDELPIKTGVIGIG